jgi:hypothetical protein
VGLDTPPATGLVRGMSFEERNPREAVPADGSDSQEVVRSFKRERLHVRMNLCRSGGGDRQRGNVLDNARIQGCTEDLTRCYRAANKTQGASTLKESGWESVTGSGQPRT